MADRFFLQLPPLAMRFFQNGILLGTLTAVLLNFLFSLRQRAGEGGSIAAQSVPELR